MENIVEFMIWNEDRKKMAMGLVLSNNRKIPPNMSIVRPPMCTINKSICSSVNKSLNRNNWDRNYYRLDKYFLYFDKTRKKMVWNLYDNGFYLNGSNTQFLDNFCMEYPVIQSWSNFFKPAMKYTRNIWIKGNVHF